MTSCRFLRFSGPIIGSLKSPYTNSYRSSVETIAPSSLVCEKNRVFWILATDRLTDRQTDGQARCIKPLSLSRAAANKP